MADVCRGCDGRKFIERTDKDNVMRTMRKTCSRCTGSGLEPGPPKGTGKRPFFPKAEETESERSIEAMTRAFLRSRGH